MPILPTRKVRTRGVSVVRAIQDSDARADRVEVAIDKTGALGMFDVFINNLGARTRRMIDIDARGAFVATQAGVRAYERGWTHRWRLLRWRTRDGANPRILRSPKARSKCLDGCCREKRSVVDAQLGWRTSSRARSVWISIPPSMGVRQKADTALNHCADVNRAAALVAFVAGPQASSYPNHP
jgi:hypothetical protein